MTNPFADPGPATATAPPAAPAPAPPPAAQPTAPAATVDQFGGADPFANSDPAPQGDRARLREMHERLLIILPRSIERGRVSQTFKNPDGSPVIQDRMTADVVVLDGGTLHYGGKPERLPAIPHTKSTEVPVKFDGMYISSAGLISQCRVALDARQQGKPGMVIGRLAKGQDSGKGEPPWILTPATDADKAIGRAWLASNDPFTNAS